VWLDDRLFDLFLGGVVRSATGRRYVLTQLVAAEATANGDGGLFDRIREYVQCPRMRALVLRHQTDEIRHEQLLVALLADRGGPLEVPRSCMLLHIAEDVLGDYPARRIQSDRDLVEAYSFIRVLECRAIGQLSAVAAAFDRVDPEVAAVLRRMRADELRHVRWCDAILTRHAADKAEVRDLRSWFRWFEELAYHRHNLRGARFLFARGIVSPPAPAKGAWLALIGCWYVVFGAWVGALALTGIVSRGPRTGVEG